MEKCQICRKTIAPANSFEHNGDLVCEDCCMEARATKPRKTHWQYLKSIETEYLRPGKPGTSKESK